MGSPELDKIKIDSNLQDLCRDRENHPPIVPAYFFQISNFQTHLLATSHHLHPYEVHKGRVKIDYLVEYPV